jgi:hypothetical protein
VFHPLDAFHDKRLVFRDSVEESLELHLMSC